MLSTESAPAAAETALAYAPRTYFIGGHRVEHVRSAVGQRHWICDCAEYTNRRQHGGEHWCQHAERVAAAAELDRLLRTPSLFVSRKSY
jgi:hypothetical protein